MSQPEPRSTLEMLSRAGNSLIVVTAMCYLTGFIIVNLYLNSFGIVNIEILKARYITAGILFLIFIGISVVLLYELLLTLQSKADLSIAKLTVQLVWKSVINLAILQMIISAIAQITEAPIRSDTHRLANGPSVTQIIAEVLTTLPRTILMLSLFLLACMLVLVVLVLFIMILVPGKKDEQGKRRSRREVLSEFFVGVKTSGAAALWGILRIVLILSAVYSLFRMGSLLTGGGALSFNYSDLSLGWQRFLLGIVITYGIGATYMLLLYRRQPNGLFNADVIKSKAISWLYLGAYVGSLLIPLYAVGIYPYLSQQIGGGAPVAVTVQVTEEDLQAQFSAPGSIIYLIDRTSSSMLFIVSADEQTMDEAIEVSSDSIVQIKYSP